MGRKKFIAYELPVGFDETECTFLEDMVRKGEASSFADAVRRLVDIGIKWKEFYAVKVQHL